MQIKDDFHFTGIDVEAARNDHPLLETRNKYISVLVDPGKVARVQPPVPHYFPGCFIVLVISPHDVIAPDDKLPFYPRRHLTVFTIHNPCLHAGDNRANGTGFMRPLWPGKGTDRRGFRKAVTFHDLY